MTPDPQRGHDSDALDRQLSGVRGSATPRNETLGNASAFCAFTPLSSSLMRAAAARTVPSGRDRRTEPKIE